MVQACHAALEAGFAFKAPAENASLVVLAVSNQAELKAAASLLKEKCIDHQLFFEPDGGMGYSALATRPIGLPTERKVLRKYQLHPGFPVIAEGVLTVAGIEGQS